MLTRRVALILRIGAGLFFLASLALLIRPDQVAHYFGFAPTILTPEFRWVLRLMGAIFLIPALLAPLVAAFAGERGLRQAASGMAFISLGVGVLILSAPIPWTAGMLSASALGIFFSLGYFFALRGRRRNR
jgi:hypothetical protein